MLPAPIPPDEARRLEALHRYQVLDTPAEECFDDLALLAAAVCGVPVALVTLIDSDRQWFKAKTGTQISETARNTSFCGHAILHQDVFVIPDAAADSRFADNPFVTQHKVRFYAGAPMVTPQGAKIGTVCVLDFTPRELTGAQKKALAALARQAAMHLELRLAVNEMEKALSESGVQWQAAAAAEPATADSVPNPAAQVRRAASELISINQQLRTEAVRRRAAQEALRASEEKHRLVLETATDAILLLDESNTVRYANPALEEIFGYAPVELTGKSAALLLPESQRAAIQPGFQNYLQSHRAGAHIGELTCRRKNGEEFPAEAAFNQVTLAGKRLFALFLRDLSQRPALQSS